LFGIVSSSLFDLTYEALRQKRQAWAISTGGLTPKPDSSYCALTATRPHRDTSVDQGTTDGFAGRIEPFGESSERHAVVVETHGIRNSLWRKWLPSQPDAVVSQDLENGRLAQAVALHQGDGGVTLPVVRDQMKEGFVPEALSDVAKL
jgi:hypothetical protein